MFLFLLLNSDFHNVNDDYDAFDDELIVTFTRIAEEKKRNSFYFYVNLFFKLKYYFNLANYQLLNFFESQGHLKTRSMIKCFSLFI